MLEYGWIVEHNGRRGVTVQDFMNCCDESETPVVFEGENAFIGVTTIELKVIGPENAKADFVKCGGGKIANCCIFMVSGPDGFECHRHGDLRHTIIFRKEKMIAKRQPVKAFPECQSEPLIQGGSSTK